jgi:hypothetical protein
MRLITTTAGDEQIEIKATPEKAVAIRKITSPCEAQASLIKSMPTSSPIILNTLPYPISGPGGPSLTSRRH